MHDVAILHDVLFATVCTGELGPIFRDLKLAATEDENWIHPERLVVHMPRSKAGNYQNLLQNMNPKQRLADRRALLFLDCRESTKTVTRPLGLQTLDDAPVNLSQYTSSYLLNPQEIAMLARPTLSKARRNFKAGGALRASKYW